MKNKKDAILNMYFVKKMKPIDIAKKLNVSKSAVSQVLEKDERYSNEKEMRKIINRKKHIENTKEYIKSKRQTIQFEHKVDDLILRNIHNQASTEMSKPNKLSDLAYRNWNTSAYTYNKQKKRFEFREELGRSYDVKKYIRGKI